MLMTTEEWKVFDEIVEDRFRFRAWDKNNEFMLDQVQIGNYKFKYFSRKHLVFMQCVGLRDKNGKLIYEGDILGRSPELSTTSFIAVVSHSRHGFGATSLPGSHHYIMSNRWDDDDCRYRVVLGNIYENQELLKAHAPKPY